MSNITGMPEKGKLSRIESLPQEILGMIYMYDLGLDFPRASPYIGFKLPIATYGDRMMESLRMFEVLSCVPATREEIEGVDDYVGSDIEYSEDEEVDDEEDDEDGSGDEGEEDEEDDGSGDEHEDEAEDEDEVGNGNGNEESGHDQAGTSNEHEYPAEGLPDGTSEGPTGNTPDPDAMSVHSEKSYYKVEDANQLDDLDKPKLDALSKCRWFDSRIFHTFLRKWLRRMLAKYWFNQGMQFDDPTAADRLDWFVGDKPEPGDEPDPIRVAENRWPRLPRQYSTDIEVKFRGQSADGARRGYVKFQPRSRCAFIKFWPAEQPLQQDQPQVWRLGWQYFRCEHDPADLFAPWTADKMYYWQSRMWGTDRVDSYFMPLVRERAAEDFLRALRVKERNDHNERLLDMLLPNFLPNTAWKPEENWCPTREQLRAAIIDGRCDEKFVRRMLEMRVYVPLGKAYVNDWRRKRELLDDEKIVECVRQAKGEDAAKYEWVRRLLKEHSIQV